MGLEPTTPCLQSRCSSQLSYSPVNFMLSHLVLTGKLIQVHLKEFKKDYIMYHMALFQSPPLDMRPRFVKFLAAFVSASLLGTTLFAASVAVSPAAGQEAEGDGPLRWHTYAIASTAVAPAVQSDGTTANQIRQTLGMPSSRSVYSWHADEQAWERITQLDQTIPEGTIVSFATRKTLTQTDLDSLKLGPSGPRTRLAAGWNIISIPQAAARFYGPSDSADKTALTPDTLTDCAQMQGILAIANYSANTGEWHLWLPCRPRTQQRLTAGENPPYQRLAAISPGDTTYVYARTGLPLNIAWNS